MMSEANIEVSRDRDERINVLIVDDLPDKLLVLESVLAELGENVILARSGGEALQQVLKRDFAVILLDVNMPDLDGYETAALIRQRKRSSLTPIIFVTGFADEVHRAQGYSLGAVDYVLSPVSPEILRSKVKVFVDLARMSREIQRHADQRIALAKEQAAREAAEQAAEALRASEERFRLASEAVNGFIYEIEAASGLMTFSSGLFELLGFNAGEIADWRAWLDRATEEDRARMASARGQALEEGSHKYRLEYRVRHRDGHFLDVWDQGLIDRDAAGEPRRFIGNVVDITERKRAAEALAEANRRKDEFLAMLAHELRNPLAPIRNAVQLLRMLAPNEPGVVTPREIIDRNVNQMVRLVDDLLDVSRITRGKIRLQIGRVDLAAILAQAIEISRPIIDDRDHRLSISAPERALWVEGDAARLAQIISNLLNNAAKYTDPGGRIDVSLAAVEGKAVLQVRDNGVGMAPDVLEEVFGLFTQVERSPDRSQGGLGIGLTLVKRLVEMHGGIVRAESEGLGRGSLFTVQLPLLAEPQQPQTTAPQATPSETANHKLRVLAVDDNVDAATTLALLIQISGHDVRTAHDGPSAISAAESYRPDVILLDIGLPGLDGYEVAQRLRSTPQVAGVVLVAVTGYGQEEDRRRSFAAGFDHHLVKPANPQVLMNLLSTCKPAGQ